MSILEIKFKISGKVSPKNSGIPPGRLIYIQVRMFRVKSVNRRFKFCKLGSDPFNAGPVSALVQQTNSLSYVLEMIILSFTFGRLSAYV